MQTALTLITKTGIALVAYGPREISLIFIRPIYQSLVTTQFETITANYTIFEKNACGIV